MNCELYKKEKIIAKLVKRKLENYANSKERIKKENELFHLLCFLDVYKKRKLENFIYPHEPGDFILKINNKKIMVEVVECFGNPKTYKDIKNKLNKIFKRDVSRNFEGEYNFTIEESLRKFEQIFNAKNNNKEYLNNPDFSEVILLIVTGEYENCPITGNWIIKFLEEKDFVNNKYNKVCVLDYFASGVDGGPIILEDALEELVEYNKIMRKYS